MGQRLNVNEKYLAGFLDADGHLSVRARKGARPDLDASFAQRAEYRDILEYAQSLFGGVIREKFDGQHCELQMRSGPARKAMERLKKYMVLKRHHAEQFLELVDGSTVLHTNEEVKQVREIVKSIRRQGAQVTPNYPARKWLAGYIDGDGSFTVKVCNKTGYAYPKLTIMAAPNYTVGIELIQKCFGGVIAQHGNNFLYTLQLSQPSKTKEFLGFFAKHSHVKQGQVYFLLGCAKNGHFRDGATIREAVKTLNAQQHRLSDPTSHARELLSTVNFDIQKRPCNWVGRDAMKRQSNLRSM